MATVKQIVGSFSAVTVTGLSTLASCHLRAVQRCRQHHQPAARSAGDAGGDARHGGRQQAGGAVRQAGDTAPNLSTGPTSGTTTTDEPDLVYIGTLPLNTNATQQRKYFSVATAFGGVCRRT
jgi:hypothetical protein